MTDRNPDRSRSRPHRSPLGRQIRALQARLHHQGRLLGQIRGSQTSLGRRHHGAKSHCQNGEEAQGFGERYQDLEYPDSLSRMSTMNLVVRRHQFPQNRKILLTA